MRDYDTHHNLLGAFLALELQIFLGGLTRLFCFLQSLPETIYKYLKRKF